MVTVSKYNSHFNKTFPLLGAKSIGIICKTPTGSRFQQMARCWLYTLRFFIGYWILKHGAGSLSWPFFVFGRYQAKHLYIGFSSAF